MHLGQPPGRARIAASLATIYPTVSLFTPLLVDYDAWSDDHARSSLASQVPVNELVAKLSIRGRIARADARLHPFIAFDPLRNGGLAIVQQAVLRSGFIGVKLYPPVGFLPLGNAEIGSDRARGEALDAALRGLYALCESEEIPITAHASPGNEFALAATARWRRPCGGRRCCMSSRIPVRLNFGHFGHETGTADGAEGIDDAQRLMRQAAEIITGHRARLCRSRRARRWSNDRGLRGALRRASASVNCARAVPACCCAPDVRQRLVAQSLRPARRDRGHRLSALCHHLARPRGRETVKWAATRSASSVPRRSDDRLAIGNRNQQRLRAFYGGEPLPAWLG